jgi:hypothetical protein
VLAGFLVAAAVIGFIADVLSLWPRIQAFFKKTSVSEFMEFLRRSEPITLNIGLHAVSAVQKKLTWLTDSKLHSLTTLGRPGTLFFLTHPAADHVTVLAVSKKLSSVTN